MTNKPINPVEEFAPLEEIAKLSIDFKMPCLVPRSDISFLLKKHYGFRLPDYCSIYINSDKDKEYGTFMLYIDSGRFGRVKIRQMINSPYFKYMSIFEEDDYLVYMVFVIKVAFKREYNALRGQHEFA
jgi:hypothetical protein